MAAPERTITRRSSGGVGDDRGAQRSRRAEWVVVGACLAVGAVLRFTPRTPMWLDEALTANIAGGPFGDITDRLRSDGHPPLFYWALHVWMRVFGESTFAARALPGVLGLAAIVLVWQVGRRHGGATLGLLAAALLAASPYGIRYSSETRMYSLLLVLVLAGWLLIDRALTDPRPVRLAPVAIVSGALLLTHYWAIFLLAAVGALLVGSAVATRGMIRRAHVRVAVALGAGGVFFLPWLPTFRYQAEHTGTPWAQRSRPTRVVSESVVDWSGGLHPESILLAFGVVALALLGLFANRRAGAIVLEVPAPGWRRSAAWVLGATLAVGSVASFVTDSAFAGRYASVYFPFFLLLAAAGLACLGPWTRCGALALVAVLGFAVAGAAIVRYDRTQAGEVAASIRGGAETGDLVVVCPDQLGPALSRLVELPGVRLVRYPDLGSIRTVDWVDYRERLDAVDPAAVAGRVLDEAGDGAIWLQWNGGYAVAGEQCESFAATLMAARPGALVVRADNVTYFESSSLVRLAPPGP